MSDEPLANRVAALEARSADMQFVLRELGEANRAALDAMRDDVNGLRTEMGTLRTELRGEMTGLRTELRGEMAALRTELRGGMAEQGRELRGEMNELRTDLRGQIRASAARQTGLIGILVTALSVLVVLAQILLP